MWQYGTTKLGEMDPDGSPATQARNFKVQYERIKLNKNNAFACIISNTSVIAIHHI